MAYSEDVNINLNVLAGAMGGVTAIMGGMSALTSTFGQFGTEASNAFGILDGLLVSATALIGTFTVQSAQAFGEFEQGMKIVQTVSNQTSYAMNELTNKANEMSIAYRTSIGDITDGLQTLGRAGLNSVSEQLDVLESGLQTAKLEGRNLNGVLEELIQNTAMLGGDLKSVDFGEQTEYLNTLMVGTSMTAPIDSHDISQTLQYAGGTAAAAGANLENKDKLEDLMGTVAAFAQKGVKGSMAGTALRAFFTKPASQDESVTNALGSIGLSPESLWEDGGESMRKVSDQIGIIQRRMDALNLSTMDQVELWGKIVGPKMGQQMMKLDSKSIKDLTSDIQDAKSAEDLATQTLQTYTQKLAEMQQQGDLAFREFGEKAAQWLTPIVQGITYILQLLSEPHINTIAFAVIGSILSHGIQRAWHMISSMFSEIKMLLSNTTSAIQNINSIAGGSAEGFGQSASQVDFLNRKLHETDATLQAIQAKSMGIRPGYAIPGGQYTDKVYKGTLKAYEEDVVIDSNGLMGGAKGQIYPGQYAESYKKSAKKEIASIEEEIENRKLKSEQEIARINEQKNRATEAADEAHIDRIRAAKREIQEEMAALRLGLDKTAYRDLTTRDAQYKTLLAQYGSAQAIPRAQLEQLAGYYRLDAQQRGFNATPWAETGMTQDEWIESETKRRLAEARSVSATERKNFLAPLFRHYDGQLNAISEMETQDVKNLELKKEQLKELEKQGVTKIQTRMDVMTEKQFNQWYKNLDESDPMQAYSKQRTDEMFAKNGDLISKYEKQGYLPAFISKPGKETHPNTDILQQAENSGAIQEYVNADKARIAQQKALWAGEATFTKKAQSIAIQRMNAWGQAVSRGTNAITSLPSTISNLKNNIQINRRDPGSFLKENASNINRQAAALNLEKLNMAGMSAAQAMDLVAKELGVSRTELSMVIAGQEHLAEVSGLAGQEIAQLTNASRLLVNKIVEGTATEDMDSEALRAHTIAMEQDTRANAQHAVSQATASTTMGGIRGSLSSFGSGLKGAMTTVVGYMGGPFMAAMMGVTFAMQLIQEAQQKWQERMQEAEQNLSEAQDKMSTAEDTLKELYSQENSSISEQDLAKITDYQYSAMQQSLVDSNGKAKFADMYDNEVVQVQNLDWSEDDIKNNVVKTSEDLQALNESAETISLTQEENIDALKENSAELSSATYAYSQALQKESKEMNDGVFGMEGVGSKWSNGGDSMSLLSFVESGLSGILFIKNTLTDRFNRQDNGFLDSHTPVLSASQADKNYSGSTDLSPIMAENFRLASQDKGFFDSEETAFENALSKTFGNDTERIISLMKTQAPDSYNQLQQSSSVMAGMSADDAMLMQSVWKNNKEDVQILAKNMFRYEQQYDFDPNRGAAKDAELLKLGIKPTATKKNMKNVLNNRDLKSITSSLQKAKLTVQDKNLRASIDKFSQMTGGKLSEANILAMGQLQQMQDMDQIAQEQVAPGIMKTVEHVGNILDGTYSIGSNTGSSASSGDATAANARAIAITIGAEAQGKSEEREFQKLQREGLGEETIGKDVGEFRQKLAKGELPRAEREILLDLEGTSGALYSGLTDPDDIIKNANRLYNSNSGFTDSDVPYQSKLNTATWGIIDYAQKAVTSAYDRSSIGEYGGGKASGASGGGGSGDGSDKSNTGSTKSRVDLVLCSKKTIPKLNVNLFKKAPNFTILNKNFKLRDIKINSQDKPDAITDAIKNGIIETQKRMDPKIIQSEESVYDPVTSTDGTSIPSGNTPVSSDR